MNPITIILISAAIHALAFGILIRHCRAERRRSNLPVIGSDLRLTDALHKRLRNSAPNADWLNPHIMRAKVNAWRNRNSDTAP